MAVVKNEPAPREYSVCREQTLETPYALNITKKSGVFFKF